MAEKIKVYILSCGQGMTNWIEYYADKKDPLPSGLALVDLGGSNPGGSAAVEYIVDRLKTLQDAGHAPKIDICVFSHQDGDHWNLIDHFFKKLKAAAVNLGIGSVWKSGQRWGASATTAVDRLAALSATGVAFEFTDAACDYRAGQGLTALYQFGSARLRTMAANAPLTLTGPDMVKNGSSAVIVVELAGNTIILPGDATWETMMFVNNVVYRDGNPPASCFALSIPHHGALRTAVRGYARKKLYDRMNSEVVKKFAANVKSDIVIASAGFLNTHKHPRVEIMNEFSVGVTDDSDDVHAWAAYDFHGGGWARMANVTANTFTTVTTITAPPAYHDGVFSLTGGGSVTFDLVERRPSDGTQRVVYHRVLRSEAREDA